MKHLAKYLFALSIFFLAACSDNNVTNESEVIQIIPQPQSVKINKGSFQWNNETTIILASDNEELTQIADYLKLFLENSTNREVIVKKDKADTKNAIIFNVDTNISNNKEAYTLNVDKNRINITGQTAAGVFFGVQSLLQLMPTKIEDGSALENIKFDIQAVKIEDAPRFEYRGMHLDVSRNFHTKDEVLKFIDILSMFKFNRFHWHLTDGAGWRLEIKKYPLLTHKTAFRSHPTWKEFWTKGDRKFTDSDKSNIYGGFYTQDDAREVVAYAASKFITVIPEIEMPGHSEEVFVAYPKLSCSGKAYVNSDFCVGNDDVFTFIDDVLTEVIDIFPSEYIHIGGDEAAKSAWKTCPKCKKRMANDNLKDVDELQSYFVKRVNKILEEKGRKLIGWDEIAEGGLAPDATVMVWRDVEHALAAAKAGHHVVMTPGNYCYLDFYQADPTTEPEAIGGYLTLNKVYSFDPVIDESIEEFVLGGQANLWCEYIPTYSHVEYMVFPRAIALAEAVWSPKSRKDWDSFKLRLSNILPRLDSRKVNYHKPTNKIDIFEKTDVENKRIAVYFETEQYNPEIRYTTDGSKPTKQSTLYTDTFYMENGTVNASIFIGEGAQEPLNSKQVSYHKAIGKKVTYNTRWQSYSAGGETALVDGIKGGYSYSDQLWQGFTSDMDLIIDMEEATTLNSISANFMQLIGPQVYMPSSFEVSVSKDGINYETVLKTYNDIPSEKDRLTFKDFGGNLGGKEARYIRIFVKNPGKGNKFTFVDEFVIN